MTQNRKIYLKVPTTNCRKFRKEKKANNLLYAQRQSQRYAAISDGQRNFYTFFVHE